MSTKKRKNKVWAFFDVASEMDKMAVCKLCKNDYSFKTTVFNLNRHLRIKHSDQVLPETFEDDTNCSDGQGMTGVSIKDDDSPKRKSTDTNEDNLGHSDAGGGGDDDEDMKLLESFSKQHCTIKQRKAVGKKRTSNLWHFFNKSRVHIGKAVCRLCKAVLSHKTSISNLKAHLIKQHPNVLEDFEKLHSLTADTDQDFLENGEQLDSAQDYEVIEEVLLSNNLETFEETEDGCGEEDATSDNALFGSQAKKKRGVPDIDPVAIGSLGINKKIKQGPEEFWIRSCENFGAYVASLMLQIPREVASNYQVQIVKRLMDEALKYQGNKDL